MGVEVGGGNLSNPNFQSMMGALYLVYPHELECAQEIFIKICSLSSSYLFCGRGAKSVAEGDEIWSAHS
jgi:hypothetical protein